MRVSTRYAYPSRCWGFWDGWEDEQDEKVNLRTGHCQVLGGLGSLKGSEGKLTGLLIQKYKQADLFLSKSNSTTNSSGSVGFPTFPAGDLMSL